MGQRTWLLVWLWVCLKRCWAEGEHWALIVDAGSTGSRLYAYHVSGQENPTFFQGGVDVRRGPKVRPGLAAFAENASEAVAQLRSLFTDGARLVPEAKWGETLAMVRCTGGVRDELSEAERLGLLKAIYDGLVATLPFVVADVAVVSGEEEAFYAFASANFLEARVDEALRQVGGTLLGALDLGGSSAQITFATGPDCDASIAQNRGGVFARSFAGLGAQAVRDRLFTSLVQTGARGDPCAHRGYSDGLEGLGDFDDCAAAILDELLGSSRARDCRRASADERNATLRRARCAIDDPIAAPLPQTRFLAMCNFFYAADFLRSLGQPVVSRPTLAAWPTPDLADLATRARAFCKLPWTTVASALAGQHPYTPAHLLPSRCFDATLILVLLRDVYALDDFPRVTFARDVQADVEIEWTLGFYLSEIVAPSALSLTGS